MAEVTDAYVCTLSDFSLRVAAEQLNEDPKERLGHVETFRKWILEQKHLKCPTDTWYLLRFLRSAKFSQLRARSLLEANLKNKTKHSDWLSDIDMTDPAIMEFIKTGVVLVLPNRGPNQRLMVLNNSRAIDISDKKWQRRNVLRALFGLMHYYLMDENDMVNGMEFIQDFSRISVKHVKFWGLDNMKKIVKLFTGAMPGRLKAFHFYNPGPVFETMTNIARPILSAKFQGRASFYGKNLEELYKDVPMEYFPLEYLPDDYKGPSQGPSNAIVERLIKDLETPRVRNQILYITSSEWGYDFSIKPDDVPSESFRQLSVD